MPIEDHCRRLVTIEIGSSIPGPIRLVVAQRPPQVCIPMNGPHDRFRRCWKFGSHFIGL
jgi:hypothetical protein